jgi:RNA polymerase sporulation-specific sigma factor
MQVDDYTELIAKASRIYKHSRIDIVDAIAVATIACHRAIETYNPDKGTKFTTYAVYCMRNAIFNLNETVDENEIQLDEVKHSPVLSAYQTEKIALRNSIEKHLNLLPEREREIVKMFFGIDYDQMTVREIAKVIGVNHQRIHFLKERALNRLRSSMLVNA